MLRRADRASRAENDNSAPEERPAIEEDGQLRTNSVHKTTQTGAVLGVSGGQKLLNAVFALVSRSRLWLHKEERCKESSNHVTRRHQAVAKVERILEELERERDLRPVSDQHLEWIAENKKSLGVFRRGKARSAEDARRLEGEIDVLRGQIETGVKGLYAYSESLEDDPALHFFANREPFWKILAALTAAHRADENTETRFKAIEDERLAVSSQIDVSFEGDLINRFARTNSSHATVNTAGRLAGANTGNTIEQHLRRLAELIFEERRKVLKTMAFASVLPTSGAVRVFGRQGSSMPLIR